MRHWIDIFRLKGPQAEAVKARRQDVIVKAGAGSGKTSTLVARYLSLLDEGYLPRGVVAITFTEKAAREMRNRIRQAIHDWLAEDCPVKAREHWQAIEADIDAARIGTIHGLCAALLRAHPAEAGIDPQFEVSDEGETAARRAQAAADTLTWAVEQPGLKPLFAAFEVKDLSGILGELLKARLDAQMAFAKPDLPSVWAAELKRALQRFAALPEVQDAIRELRELRDTQCLVDDAGDKLSVLIDTLLANWGKFEHCQTDAMSAASALYTTRHAYRPGTSGKKSSRAKAAARAWCDAYDEHLQPWLGGKKDDDPAPDVAVEQQMGEWVRLLGQLFEQALQKYQAAKDLRQVLDFDDLESGAQRLLEDATIRSRWQKQIDALLVDEFQDTNERQRRIVEALAGVAEGKTGRLFVVGDEKQSIYRFRGADVTVFRQLDHDIRARGGLPLTLDTTFRAHAALVSIQNEMLQQVMGTVDDPARPYAVPFLKLKADRKEPDKGITAPYVEFLYGLGTGADESRPAAAQLLAKRLSELRNTTQIQWEDIALLFQASTGFPYYEAALEAAGIPFVTVAGRGFYDRPEIRDLLNILRALADPWDDLALAGLLRSPAFGLSDAALYQLRWPDGSRQPLSFWAALASNLAHLSETDRRQTDRARTILQGLVGLVDRIPVAELLKQILDHTHYPAILASTDSGARLQRNVDKLLADAHTSGKVRVAEFLEYLETLQAAGAREGEAPTEAGGAVRLMTMHKAKGLQFPVVVIADASYQRPHIPDPVLLSSTFGVVPKPGRLDYSPLIFGLARQGEKEQAEAENLRLLYVAMTRAREKLIICGHQLGKSADVWLSKLAEAAGLGLNSLEVNTGAWQSITLPESGQMVGGFALTAVVGEGSHTAVSAAQIATDTQPIPLYRPYVVDMPPEEIPDELREVSELRRARRVLGRRHPDGTLVGRLVHEAIRRWKFPDDPALDRLLTTTALEVGLVDKVEMDTHIQQAKLLLARFRADPRWAEIDAAERRHEVPYSLLQKGRASGGFMDLLYRGADNQWKVVDFKTDAIQDQAELEPLLQKGYRKQMQRYRAATSELLGQAITTTLCFLDYVGDVCWKDVA